MRQAASTTKCNSPELSHKKILNCFSIEERYGSVFPKPVAHRLGLKLAQADTSAAQGHTQRNRSGTR